jgi:hypothetical protein
LSPILHIEEPSVSTRLDSIKAITRSYSWWLASLLSFWVSLLKMTMSFLLFLSRLKTQNLNRKNSFPSSLKLNMNRKRLIWNCNWSRLCWK